MSYKTKLSLDLENICHEHNNSILTEINDDSIKETDDVFYKKAKHWKQNNDNAIKIIKGDEHSISKYTVNNKTKAVDSLNDNITARITTVTSTSKRWRSWDSECQGAARRTDWS